MLRRPLAIFGLFWCLLGMQAQWCVAQLDNVPAEHAQQMAQGLALFKSEVRTIFVGRCLKCHGGESTEGELSLLSRELLLAGGASGPAVDLASAADSLLIRLITHEEEPRMPEDGAKLDPRQIEAVGKWISLGAPYDKPLKSTDEDPLAWTQRAIDESARDFWAFQPLHEVAVPLVDEQAIGGQPWVRTDIDRFVLDKLQNSGLQPNPVATKRQLLRRAYFDLTGMPPSVAEVESFINDSNPAAYELLLDRLLSSPHFGERVGRHWLDIARFAESHGFEQDYDRPHAYHYRDFVIQALNSDMPYDQFVRWQIAGDELAPNDPRALMATGFLGAGVFPTQLTEKEFESARYDELDDMVATLGTAMLGITIGCARCHDHKFDPIPARDYYQLVSAFRSTIRSNVEIELDPAATATEVRRWEAELKPLEEELARYEREELPTRVDEFWADWVERSTSAVPGGVGEGIAPFDVQKSWVTLVPTAISSEGGATFSAQSDGSYVVSGTNSEFDTYSMVMETSLTNMVALRLEALAGDELPHGGPGRADNGNFGLSRIALSVQPLDSDQAPVEVPLLDPQVTFQQNDTNLSIASSLDNEPQSGWAIDPRFGENHAATFRLQRPVGFTEGTRVFVRLEFKVNNRHSIGHLRLAVSCADERPGLTAAGISQEAAELLQLPIPQDGRLSDDVRRVLVPVVKKSNPQWLERQAALDQHLASRPKPTLTTVMVCSENVPPIPNHGDGRGFPHFYQDSYFLLRGDVHQKQGIAPEGVLQVLTSFKSGDGREPWEHWKATEVVAKPHTSLRRTAVAKWITDTQNGAGHLLARVIVNRLWQQHLGVGLVGTPNDFGFQGERPSHPELLDWLAGELIREQWRLKPIRKLIMSSAVYMQDSHYDSSRAAGDPNNRLLWRFSPRRLEADLIRDSLLAVSGELDDRQFGPGTLDEAMRRRSIYFFIKRSQLIPFLQVFDTPEPLASVGQRPTTTIAPQALIFMNNPHVRGYAEAFAKRVLGDGQAALETNIRQAMLAAVARQPTAFELEHLSGFAEEQLLGYAAAGKADAKQLAFSDLCQVLMSLSEFVYVD